MTSSNGNIFRVTGRLPVWGESTGHRWIPLTIASDLRRHRAHYDVTVMKRHNAIWSGCRITSLCVNHTWLTLSFSPNQQAMFFLTSGKTVWPSTKARGVTEEMFNSATTSQLMNWLRRWRRPWGKADRQFKLKWQSKSLTTPFFVKKCPSNKIEIPKLRITILFVADFYWLRRASMESYQETQLYVFAFQSFPWYWNATVSLDLLPRKTRTSSIQIVNIIVTNDIVLLLPWINFNSSSDKWLRPLLNVEWNYLPDGDPNFNGCTVEVWERISNFIPHFTGHLISYSYRD